MNHESVIQEADTGESEAAKAVGSVGLSGYVNPTDVPPSLGRPWSAVPEYDVPGTMRFDATKVPEGEQIPF